MFCVNTLTFREHNQLPERQQQIIFSGNSQKKKLFYIFYPKLNNFVKSVKNIKNAVL